MKETQPEFGKAVPLPKYANLDGASTDRTTPWNVSEETIRRIEMIEQRSFFVTVR